MRLALSGATGFLGRSLIPAAAANPRIGWRGTGILGSSLDDVVWANWSLRDRGEFDTFFAEWRRWFTDETDVASRSAADWGDTRLLYLQHASDPVVFFTPDLLLDKPDWLAENQRGAGLSEDFVWVPFVTVWQVLTDMTAATSVPDGYGHL